jgi:hypothetical protein
MNNYAVPAFGTGLHYHRLVKQKLRESSEASTPNVMEFLIYVCPRTFSRRSSHLQAPQKTAVSSKVNRVWRDVVAEEWTWRVLCKDLYKVRSCSFLVSIPSP